MHSALGNAPFLRTVPDSRARCGSQTRGPERGSVSRSRLSGRAPYRTLKHACSPAARCGPQTRGPLPEDAHGARPCEHL